MNNFINLAHLKFFCDTVVYQSISEAAKMNFISQPAVTQAIQKLENVFGVPLLIHNKQKLIVTKHGQIVFDQAPEIFKSVKETFDKVNETKGVITGILKFVTTKSLGMSFFAPTYSKIRKNLPHVDARIDMGGKNYIRSALKREDVEFAIVVYDHNFAQFAKHSIKKGHFNLYQSKKAPNNIIDQGVFIDANEGMHIHQLNEFFSENNHSFKINAIAGWELVANFANLGIGVGFFPDYIASEARFPNLKPHPIKTPPFEYEIAAIYNKSTHLSQAARAIIEQFTLE
jgi:DNA-binding transcriptional LysR family regulator